MNTGECSFRPVGLPALYNGLDVLGLVGRCSRTRRTLIALQGILTRERAEEETKAAEFRPLEEHEYAVDAETEAFRVVLILVNELTAKRYSLTTGAEQSKA